MKQLFIAVSIKRVEKQQEKKRKAGTENAKPFLAELKTMRIGAIVAVE